MAGCQAVCAEDVPRVELGLDWHTSTGDLPTDRRLASPAYITKLVPANALVTRWGNGRLVKWLDKRGESD